MSQGRVALVSGASRGIGAAIARHLGQAGFRVAGTATSEAGAETITQTFAAAGIDGRGFVLDVADGAQCERVVADVQAQMGDVAILVNNAGITRDNLLMRMKDDEWDAIMATNVRGMFVLSKLVLRGMMKARWGRIVNVTSVVGFTGNAGQANYAAAKAAMVGFAKSLAREVGSRNITVNSVAPGFIDTDMTRALTDEQREALLKQVPLGRLGAVD
ncbi:MAG: 3-oxoacyl-ACP reductase FabG, partial [Burkholderiales bacterium]|nr:3-oxoacyl-ACP reductase FabG [Burkholderiales bacterium]